MSIQPAKIIEVISEAIRDPDAELFAHPAPAPAETAEGQEEGGSGVAESVADAHDLAMDQSDLSASITSASDFAIMTGHDKRAEEEQPVGMLCAQTRCAYLRTSDSLSDGRENSKERFESFGGSNQGDLV